MTCTRTHCLVFSPFSPAQRTPFPFRRLIQKRRSRSDCDLGPEALESPVVPPPAPAALRVTMPPRSIAGLGSGPSKDSQVRNRMRSRPLPSPGVEDLCLFPGTFQAACQRQTDSATSSSSASAVHSRCPRRSASGTELCMRPADYHEFFPASGGGSDSLSHSSASLLTGGSSTTTISTAPFAAGPTPGSGAPGSASGAAPDVPLSPIREDLRSSSSGMGPSCPAGANASFCRRR